MSDKSDPYHYGTPADGPIVDQYGNKEWWVKGQRHRDGDLPAIILADGSKYWYKHGHSHRIGNPAIIMADGDVYYRINGNRILDIPKTPEDWTALVLQFSNK